MTDILFQSKETYLLARETFNAVENTKLEVTILFYNILILQLVIASVKKSKLSKDEGLSP